MCCTQNNKSTVTTDFRWTEMVTLQYGHKMPILPENIWGKRHFVHLTHQKLFIQYVPLHPNYSSSPHSEPSTLIISPHWCDRHCCLLKHGTGKGVLLQRFLRPCHGSVRDPSNVMTLLNDSLAQLCSQEGRMYSLLNQSVPKQDRGGGGRRGVADGHLFLV